MDNNKNIGEMFLVGFEGTSISKDLEDMIKKYHIGGVILYSRNIKSIGQAAKLCEEMQKIRRTVSDTPLFIAIDQEGGVVQRVVDGVTVLPGNMAIGSVGDEDCAYAAGRITATELICIGINVNFAPVVDISNNSDNPTTGVRSFGSDPDNVARLGSSMIQGLQEYGIIACAKHFPGKGNVKVDSHVDLPLNNSGRDSIYKCELVPFDKAISAGVRMIMTAHVMYPELTENKILPATLSHNIVTKLLREEMGFKGVIITDDMEMGAITKYFTLDESVLKAVEAGTDIIMLCHTIAAQKEAIIALEKYVNDGKIKPERLSESHIKITALKKKIVSRGANTTVDASGIPFHRMISDRIARDSITIHKNEKNILPLFLNHGEKLLAIVPKYEALSQVEDKEGDDEVILEELKQRHQNSTIVRIAVSPDEKDFSIINKIGGFDRILMMTYNAHLNDRQLNFAKKLLAEREDAVIIALRNPFDLMKLPQAVTTVATYGFRNCSLKALVEVLFGEIEAKGKMPVKL